jgi:hypothetical protein
MWECQFCRVSIKDKYKFCWNCARPRSEAEALDVQNGPQTAEPLPITPIEGPSPPITPIEALSPHVVEEIASPPLVGERTAEEAPSEPPPAFNHRVVMYGRVVENEPETEPSVRHNDDFLSSFKPGDDTRPPSKVMEYILLIVWFAAIVTVGAFAYLSWQKMNAFSQKIENEGQNFNAQKSRFVFPGKPSMRRGTVIELGSLKPKVLPLDLKSNEVASLFWVLPDDLRPTSAEEVKTVMWHDCKNEEVGKYTDGTTGFRENCTVYLVEQASSKIIAIQDFLGVMPALSKERDGGDAVGRVMPERYIAFLREKQPESERTTLATAPDSPHHHYFSKSELIYSLLILGALVAIGFGWLAYKLKFNWDAD